MAMAHLVPTKATAEPNMKNGHAVFILRVNTPTSPCPSLSAHPEPSESG